MMTDVVSSIAAGVRDPQTIHPCIAGVLARPQFIQRSPEWYEVRKGLITASDAGGALNIPAFKSQRYPRRDCLRQKTSGTFTGNHMTRHGQKYEDDVRERPCLHWGNRRGRLACWSTNDTRGLEPVRTEYPAQAVSLRSSAHTPGNRAPPAFLQCTTLRFRCS